MKNKISLVIDTNVMLVAIAPQSKYHFIIESLIENRFDLFITSEILLEYEEVMQSRYNEEVVKNFFSLLSLLPNVHRTNVYFNWDLIKNDPDDNKFVGCAVAANADVIVTQDKHFNVLETIEFPKTEICNIEQLREMLVN